MKRFTVFGVLFMVLGGQALAHEGHAPFIEGVHYINLNQAAPARQSEVITVTELFSYGCHACNEFEPFMQSWKARQAEDVKLNRIPVGFGRRAWELLAKGYLMAEILGVEEQAHVPLMNAIWKDGLQIRSVEDLADFYSKHGADRDKFLSLDNGFMLNMRLKQNTDKLGVYAIRGTPTMVVDGKYKIQTGQEVPTYADMLVVVDHLVDQERSARAPAVKAVAAKAADEVVETANQ